MTLLCRKLCEECIHLEKVPHITGESASNAFEFENGAYRIADSLEYGLGYWLQFSPNDTFGVVGTSAITSDTISVRSGWNMIGSASTPVPVSAILSEPPGMVASNFFGYEDRYA